MTNRSGNVFIGIISLLAAPLGLLGFVGLAFAGSPHAPSPFQDEIERDFALRARGQLQVTNMRGDIVIQCWSLDKIRVKARRRAVAVSEPAAKKLLSAVDFRFQASEGLIELSAEYGRGLDLQERLRERANPQTSMEMVIFAPASLKLRVWGVDGKITVKGWKSNVDIRAASGDVQIDHIRNGSASVLCSACAVKIHDVIGPVRCMGGSGMIEASEITAPQTYIETSAGPINVFKVKGEQLYVSKGGSIRGRELQGRIEFHAQSGLVEILESEGFLSGRTTSGDILGRMREWRFADKAVIESSSGNVLLSLPADFSGDVDLTSMTGKTAIGFDIDRMMERTVVPKAGEAARPVGKISGRVGDGGELLKIFSERGNIQVVRGG
ncbi:DUF4097 family beta strand repeat-containing protein [Bdellovibrionota bacterium FG-1]